MLVGMTSCFAIFEGLFLRMTSINVSVVSYILVGFAIFCFKPNTLKIDFSSLLSFSIRKFIFASPRIIVSLQSSAAFVNIELKRALKSFRRYLELSGGRYIIAIKIPLQCLRLGHIISNSFSSRSSRLSQGTLLEM